MSNQRFCPDCQSIIFYSSKKACERAKNNNSFCVKCRQKAERHWSFGLKGKDHPCFGRKVSDETKKKISISNTGKKRTDEQKIKIAEQLKGEKCYLFGKKRSLEVKIKISENVKKLNNKPWLGKKHSEESKLKMSISRKKICENQKAGRTFNKKACDFIDKLNLEKGWNLQHGLNGGEIKIFKYFVDGYDKEKNIIFEYDDPAHFGPQKYTKHAKREEEILIYLKNLNVPFEFWRYDELKEELKKIYPVE